METVKSELFSGISEVEGKKLYKSMKIRRITFKKGDVAYKFSTSVKEIGFIVKGSAKVIKNDFSGNQILLEILPSGSLFGNAFSYALRDSEYIVVVATENLTVDFILEEELMKTCDGECCDNRHKFVLNVLSIMSKKTAQISQRIEVVSCKTIREKLICYFSSLASKNRMKEFKLEQTLSAIAEYIAVDRSAMMRELKRLKDEKIIIIKDKIVELNV